MINIQIGQTLKYKQRGWEFDVLEVFTNTAIIKESNNRDIAPAVWTFEKIEECFELPKEEWEPKVGEKCWFILSSGYISYAYWEGSSGDKYIKDFMGIYKDQESAEEALAEIKAKLGK